MPDPCPHTKWTALREGDRPNLRWAMECKSCHRLTRWCDTLTDALDARKEVPGE